MDRTVVESLHATVKIKGLSKRFRFRFWVSCLIMRVYAAISQIRTTIELKKSDSNER